MKYLTFYLAFLFVAFFSIEIESQSWFPQQVNSLPNSENVIFSAVDSNVCWGINYSQFVRTTNGGTNWIDSTITGTTGFFSCISALDANTAFAAWIDYTFSTNNGLFKTTDGGQTWTKQTTAFPGSGGYPKVIHFFNSNDGVVIGNPHNGNWEIYITTNGGTLWDSLPSANIPAPGIYAGISEMINVYTSTENSIWFFTDGPFPNSVRRMFRSTDKGLTWSANPNYVIGCAFKDSLNGLATAENNYIFRTTDGGITWTLLPNGPATPTTHFISYVKGTPGSYIITSSSTAVAPGSMYSADDGTSWEPIDNLPHGPASFANDGSGWSGGLYDIIYKWVPPITDVEDASSTVNDFGLFQNYPNPFNPSTTIKYSIPTSEFVTLKVYDVLGNEVVTLVSGVKPSGSYEIEFNAASLSSGIYFYTIKAGKFSETKKLILTK